MALEKAQITNSVTGEVLPVLFNPEEYSLNRSNHFAPLGVPGLSAPLLQFVQGEMKTLRMELFFDTYEENRFGNKVVNGSKEDVRKLTSKFAQLMDIDPTTHAPPVLLFTWSTLSFTCVLASLTQRFIMFRPDGSPVRARLEVTFNEYRNIDLEAKEIKRETSDYSKTYSVGERQTLSGIAFEVYRDPSLWRPIAIHNDIDDPRSLQVGRRLLIPQLPYRDPTTDKVYGQP
jgi:nucleoid-associated protein YgaU